MSLALPITEDQRDCLQEITNVAMGAAAESLASFTNTFIELPIPKIRYITAENLKESLETLEGFEKLSSISQLFSLSSLNCYALIVINDESIEDLGRFTSRSLENDEHIQALLTDLCNTINTTCFERLGEMLDNNLATEVPVVHSLHMPLTAISIASLNKGEELMSVEINYHIENENFSCDLLLLFPESALQALLKMLDEYL